MQVLLRPWKEKKFCFLLKSWGARFERHAQYVGDVGPRLCICGYAQKFTKRSSYWIVAGLVTARAVLVTPSGAAIPAAAVPSTGLTPV